MSSAGTWTTSATAVATAGAPPPDLRRRENGARRPSPYRFLFQIQKATELAGRVRELGGALLSAYEKGDAEYLAASARGRNARCSPSASPIRQDQWRDADWQVQALQQTKDVSQTNLLYYPNLYQNGLINNEIQNLDLTTNALQMPHRRQHDRGRGRDHEHHPRLFRRALSSGAQVPIGTKLAHLFEAIAKIMQTVADIRARLPRWT